MQKNSTNSSMGYDEIDGVLVPNDKAEIIRFIYRLTLLDKQGRNALSHIRKITSKVEMREKEGKKCFMIIC